MNVTKTELGAKMDGVETQFGSLRTEMNAKFEGVNAKLDTQNPVTAWQIFGVVVTAIAVAVGILYGFLMLAEVTYVGPDNRSEIADLLEILIAQNEAARPQNAAPVIVNENQAPVAPDSSSLSSEKGN